MNLTKIDIVKIKLEVSIKANFKASIKDNTELLNCKVVNLKVGIRISRSFIKFKSYSEK
jgi:hypothetical protein